MKEPKRKTSPGKPGIQRSPWPSKNLRLTEKPIQVGTHFSGWESICQSLKRLGIDHSLTFACDSNAACRRVIAQNFKPKYLLQDVNDDAAMDHAVDFYAAGSPCPSYSAANQKAKGKKDKQGKLFFKSLKYIKKKKPKCALLENVWTLKTRHKKVFLKAMQELAAAGYMVTHKRMNPREHGLPQNRDRLYIVAIRNDGVDGKEFLWPKRQPIKDNIMNFLDREQTGSRVNEDEECKTVRRNIQKFKEAAKIKGLNLNSKRNVYVVDALAGAKCRP